MSEEKKVEVDEKGHKGAQEKRDSNASSAETSSSPLYTLPPVEDFEWKRIESERVADCRVFQVRRDRAVNPRHGSRHDFFCIEAGDWINIIPLTSGGEVVMIEQYRHGTNEVTLEIPGGMVDAGEEAATAAARELFEETGYRAHQVQFLGRTRPNPAIQNNWLHTFLARDVEFESEPVFEATEWTVVRLVPLKSIPSLIKSCVITHALVVTAFHWLSLEDAGLVSSE